MWTSNWITTNKLRLYRTGCFVDNGFGTLEHCKGCKESTTHIFWGCLTLGACWSLLLPHWTGEGVERFKMSNHFRHRSSSGSPLPQRVRQLLFIVSRMATSPRRIWFVLCSVCQLHLWVERNAAVYSGRDIFFGRECVNILGNRYAASEGNRPTHTSICGNYRQCGSSSRLSRTICQESQGHSASQAVSQPRHPSPRRLYVGLGRTF